MPGARCVDQNPIGGTVLHHGVALSAAGRPALLGAVVRHPDRHEGEQAQVGLRASQTEVGPEEGEALIGGASAVASHEGFDLVALGGGCGDDGGVAGGLGEVDGAGGDVDGVPGTDYGGLCVV